MRALGDPDAFPAGDLGLLRGASVRSERELAQRADAWRPWRAYAAMYLWQKAGSLENHERKSLGASLPPARAIAVPR